MLCVRDVLPLVGPIEGDGDLGPGTIAGVGDGNFCIDGEHLEGSELPISCTLSGIEAPKDSGNHFVMILESVVVIPKWSAASSSVVVVVVRLFCLELLS